MSVTTLEPWISIDDVASFFGISRRWLEYRLEDGLPSAKIAGKRRFRASEVEDWLSKEGFLER